MKLPAFIRKSRHGIYYVRIVTSQKLRREYVDIGKEFRVSLRTSNRREALYRGCRLYSEFHQLFSEENMAGKKLFYEGKLLDAMEVHARVFQREKAKFELKKERQQRERERIHSEERAKLLTDDERKEEAIKNEVTIVQATGRHSITEVIEAYSKEKKLHGMWKNGKSEQSVRSVFKVFQQVVGDKHFDLIRLEDIKRYREVILKLPVRFSTSRKYKHKSITEVIELDHADLLSTATREKYFGNVRALFEWAVGEQYTDQNYAERLAVQGRMVREPRDIFLRDELQKIISSEEYRRENGAKHKKDAFFWTPLISMFTGARVDEICRLRVEDICSADCEGREIWYFAFNSRHGEGKTDASKRNIPLHKTLIDIGFLNYVQKQKRNQQERLFPDLRWHQSNGYGAQVSKWFGRYLVDIGVKDPIKHKNKKCFHSFRHTVVNNLQEKSVINDRIKVLGGHTVDDLSYYQHGLGLKTLADEIVAKIDYGLDFAHLLDKNINEYLKM